jgi:Flp pilus assembly pilin Flp
MCGGPDWGGVGYILALVKARAQGLTEYGLILTFVAFVAIVGLTFFGNGLGDQLGLLLSNLGTSV